MIRLVSVDPACGKTAVYGYPIDAAADAKRSDAGIGDIVATDTQRILLVEHDDAMPPEAVDQAHASDLSTFDRPAANLAQRGITLVDTRRRLTCVSWAGNRRKPRGWRASTAQRWR